MYLIEYLKSRWPQHTWYVYACPLSQTYKIICDTKRGIACIAPGYILDYFWRRVSRADFDREMVDLYLWCALGVDVSDAEIIEETHLPIAS